MDDIDTAYLSPTPIIDSDHPRIQKFARETVVNTQDPVEQAVRLYLAVRDKIWYDPYSPFHLPEHYQASRILEKGRSFCVPKVSLLCALARACNIPSRAGFATVQNHLASRRLIDLMGCNVFVYHGFAELYLEGKWVKATPAFNKELCEKHKVPPLEFNGREDSLFHPYNPGKGKHMEYLEYHGTSPDIPVAKIVTAWKEAYGSDRIKVWIEEFAQRERTTTNSFAGEDPWTG